MHDEHWILVIVMVVLALALAIFAIVVHIRHKVDALHTNGQPVAKADVSVITESIEGVRMHLSSNQDELDGELRQIVSTTTRTETMLIAERENRFAQALADEMAKHPPKDDTQ